jgi:hypothetical protein
MSEFDAPQAGDIFACFGVDSISRVISWQTAVPWAPAGLRRGPSHVAIASQCVDLRDRGLVWIESTSLSRRPCLVRGERVMGCQVHTIEERVSDYVEAGGRVDLYRLTPINTLGADAVRELAQDLSWYVQQRYQYDTGSAIFSGTHLLRLADKAFSFWLPSPHSVFCSQLLAAQLQSLGLMNRDNPQRFNPGRLLRQLVAQGVYYRHSSLEGKRL